jgi:hypothetical protein
LEDCGCDGFKVIDNPASILDAYDVRGQGDIVVTPSYEPGRKVFIVKNQPYTLPEIMATHNPLREVGQTFNFTWNVNIVPGRESIVSRVITPTIDPMPDLTMPFNVTVNNQKRNSRQTVNYYSVQAGDNKGGVGTRSLSIHYVNNVYVGYSHKDGISAGQLLNAADISTFTATLADNIKAVYAGTKNYVIPPSGALKFVYFLYELGTSPINAMRLSGLNFPLLFLPGSMPIVNTYDTSITSGFVVVRSVNKFGAGTLSLEML